MREIFGKQVDSLRAGERKLDAPKAMREGQPETINLLVGGNLASVTGSPLSRTAAPIPTCMSSLMSAELTGQQFQIDSRNSTEQTIPDTGFARWRWDVTPKTSGDLKLHLHIWVDLKYPGSTDTPLDIEVVDEPINVRVDRGYEFSQFVFGNWQFVVSTIVALVVGTGWLTRGRWWRRKAAAPAPKSAEAVGGAVTDPTAAGAVSPPSVRRDTPPP